MNINDIIAGMQEKLGEENSSIIADDFASLIAYDSSQNEELNKRKNEIDKLSKNNEMLVKSNGKLLQQVSAFTSSDDEEEKQKEVKKEPLDYRTLFDKNGKFI